jgi:lysophospholipase L1-like esterase
MNERIKLGRASAPARHWRVFGALVLSMTLANFAVPGTAQADTATSSVFYLAIGASESIGVQPTAQVPHGERTDDGYTDDLVADEALQGVTLDLHEIGCAGETTATAISGADTCYTPADTQLNEAVAFLESHQDDRGLVTIDLGFNDVRTCLAALSTFSSCLNQKTAEVQTQLASILMSLKSVAGPNVVFVGLNHDDPYLAEARNGGDGPRLAHDSFIMVDRLNATLREVYASFDIPVADVAAAFALGNHSSAKLIKASTLSQGSAVACELTWMCAPAPYGPNVHPDDAGYLAIAEAIEAVLPPLS